MEATPNLEDLALEDILVTRSITYHLIYDVGKKYCVLTDTDSTSKWGKRTKEKRNLAIER